jgi:hypothetical protein
MAVALLVIENKWDGDPILICLPSSRHTRPFKIGHKYQIITVGRYVIQPV